MKKRRNQPTPSKLSVLRQLVKLIPEHLVPQLAREVRVDEQARSFSPWSHLIALGYAQIAHSISLNDVCDALQLHRGPLSAIRGATAPSKNNLSHANKRRNAQLGEKIFYKTLEHLQKVSPNFGLGRQLKRLLPRLGQPVHVVDTTTIELIAKSLDWARHRRRKAAAKCHLRLDLQSFLPRFALIDTAGEHDAKRAREVCADIRKGEIALFDKAYVNFEHLQELDDRGVWWVSRVRENQAYRVVQRRLKKPKGRILRDDIIELTNAHSRRGYAKGLRLVQALVEVDGKEVILAFLTNNFHWAATTVVELYRCRWQIEVFFKQIKQSLQLADFLGNSVNAVRWQIWAALLIYLLLRYQAFVSRWSHSFIRLWAVVRAALWLKLDLKALLESYGTAKGNFRFLGAPEQAYLPGFT